jgi:hypothetical protein
MRFQLGWHHSPVRSIFKALYALFRQVRQEISGDCRATVTTASWRSNWIARGASFVLVGRLAVALCIVGAAATSASAKTTAEICVAGIQCERAPIVYRSSTLNSMVFVQTPNEACELSSPGANCRAGYHDNYLRGCYCTFFGAEYFYQNRYDALRPWPACPADKPNYADDGFLLEVINPTCWGIAPSQITLDGPGSTKALPAGPVLQYSAKVTQGGSPAVGQAVSIKLEGEGGIAISGGACLNFCVRGGLVNCLSSDFFNL